MGAESSFLMLVDEASIPWASTRERNEDNKKLYFFNLKEGLVFHKFGLFGIKRRFSL